MAMRPTLFDHFTTVAPLSLANALIPIRISLFPDLKAEQAKVRSGSEQLRTLNFESAVVNCEKKATLLYDASICPRCGPCINE